MNALDQRMRKWWIAERTQAVYHAAMDEGKTRVEAAGLARAVKENLEIQEISVAPEEEVLYLRQCLELARQRADKMSGILDSLRHRKRDVEEDRLREERDALLTSLAISLDVPESVAWRIARLGMREIAEGDIVELAAELSA